MGSYKWGYKSNNMGYNCREFLPRSLDGDKGGRLDIQLRFDSGMRLKQRSACPYEIPVALLRAQQKRQAASAALHLHRQHAPP